MRERDTKSESERHLETRTTTYFSDSDHIVQPSQSIVADAKCALLPEMQACLCCLFSMCLVCISLVWFAIYL